MIARVALFLAIAALVIVLVHVAVPVPPAHTYDPFGLRPAS